MREQNDKLKAKLAQLEAPGRPTLSSLDVRVARVLTERGESNAGVNSLLRTCSSASSGSDDGEGGGREAVGATKQHPSTIKEAAESAGVVDRNSIVSDCDTDTSSSLLGLSMASSGMDMDMDDGSAVGRGKLDT